MVAIDSCPIHACTVTASTPRASHRHAAVCRRSCTRRPCPVCSHANDRNTADRCNRAPRAVVNNGSVVALPSAIACTRGSTRFANGTRRERRPLVAFTATPSGADRRTSSAGVVLDNHGTGAQGIWTGLSHDGNILSGWGALGATEDDATAQIAHLKATGSLRTGPERHEQ